MVRIYIKLLSPISYLLFFSNFDPVRHFNIFIDLEGKTDVTETNSFPYTDICFQVSGHTFYGHQVSKRFFYPYYDFP